MVVFFVLYLAVCFFGIRFSSKFRDEYTNREQTDSIKGIFILMVFFSHFNKILHRSGYVSSGLGDRLYFALPDWFGQLMVVMFLFYSGYGIAESIKKKGQNYINGFPQHRILTTLLNFDVAVVVYMLFSPLTGVQLEFPSHLLSFIGWESAGNSNWYIFDILLCYILVWVVSICCSRISDEKKRISVIVYCCFGLVVISQFVLSCFKELWWYDTISTFGFGMVYSLNKEKIETILKKQYYLWLAVSLVVFLALYRQGWVFYGVRYNMMSIVFALIVVIITMKVKIGNKALAWCGAHLFPIYIYQLLPSKILLNSNDNITGFFIAYPYLLVAISLTVTLIISSLYRKWQIKL